MKKEIGKKEIYAYLNKQDMQDYWCGRMGYYNDTLASEEVCDKLGVEEEDEAEVYDIVSDYFSDKDLPTC